MSLEPTLPWASSNLPENFGRADLPRTSRFQSSSRWAYIWDEEKPVRLVPLFGLAPGDACPAIHVTMNAVGSYPTISPLPGQGSRKIQAFGGMFSVALMSDCSAWVLPSTLPFGVRTFLSFPGPNENERSPHPLHDSMNNNRPF